MSVLIEIGRYGSEERVQNTPEENSTIVKTAGKYLAVLAFSTAVACLSMLVTYGIVSAIDHSGNASAELLEVAGYFGITSATSLALSLLGVYCASCSSRRGEETAAEQHTPSIQAPHLRRVHRRSTIPPVFSDRVLPKIYDRSDRRNTGERPYKKSKNRASPLPVAIATSTTAPPHPAAGAIIP